MVIIWYIATIVVIVQVLIFVFILQTFQASRNVFIDKERGTAKRHSSLFFVLPSIDYNNHICYTLQCPGYDTFSSSLHIRCNSEKDSDVRTCIGKSISHLPSRSISVQQCTLQLYTTNGDASHCIQSNSIEGTPLLRADRLVSIGPFDPLLSTAFTSYNEMFEPLQDTLSPEYEEDSYRHNGFNKVRSGGLPNSLLSRRRNEAAFNDVKSWIPRDTIKAFSNIFLQVSEGETQYNDIKKKKKRHNDTKHRGHGSDSELHGDKVHNVFTFKPPFKENSATAVGLNTALNKMQHMLLVMSSDLPQHEKDTHATLLQHTKSYSIPSHTKRKIHSDIQAKSRSLVLSLIEVHQKVTSLLEVGVRSKEVFALIGML